MADGQSLRIGWVATVRGCNEQGTQECFVILAHGFMDSISSFQFVKKSENLGSKDMQRSPCFGIRYSDFFRASDLGFRIWLRRIPPRTASNQNFANVPLELPNHGPLRLTDG